jgi:hypothetical protein
MNAEQAATLIMSCGVVQPGRSNDKRNIVALSDMAAAARLAQQAKAPTKVDLP